MTSEKLQALEHLLQRQLNAQHIEKSTSFQSFPIFVIKKKSGKERMLLELRGVNTVFQTVGSLHHGIPLPSMVPRGWFIIVID